MPTSPQPRVCGVINAGNLVNAKGSSISAETLLKTQGTSREGPVSYDNGVVG